MIVTASMATGQGHLAVSIALLLLCSKAADLLQRPRHTLTCIFLSVQDKKPHRRLHIRSTLTTDVMPPYWCALSHFEIIHPATRSMIVSLNSSQSKLATLSASVCTALGRCLHVSLLS